jgi:RNA polymerase sigma factor (sigma-70 family)
MIQDHRKLARSFTKQYAKRKNIGDPYLEEEIYQTALIAINHAVDLYDPAKGAKFETFAYTVIQYRVIDMFRQHNAQTGQQNASLDFKTFEETRFYSQNQDKLAEYDPGHSSAASQYSLEQAAGNYSRLDNELHMKTAMKKSLNPSEYRYLAQKYFGVDSAETTGNMDSKLEYNALRKLKSFY